jgi:hypothetical protein
MVLHAIGVGIYASLDHSLIILIFSRNKTCIQFLIFFSEIFEDVSTAELIEAIQSLSRNTNSQNQRSCQNHTSSISQTNGSRKTLEPRGVVIERPKYPAYSGQAVRIRSYQNWPSHITQTPRDLSRAGFFYLGDSDSVRCFFCGGKYVITVLLKRKLEREM